VQQLLAYRKTGSAPPSGVDFRLLVSDNTKKVTWSHIATTSGWHATRMNLNTFARHGVLEGKVLDAVCAKLRDPEEISRARVFPYQLLAAYLNLDSSIPVKAGNALQDAMELATANIPAYAGKVAVCPDVSGSMSSSITGYSRGNTSKVRCIDVAALVASAILRKNEEAVVLPFAFNVVNVHLNPRDSVMTNAKKLAAVGGGGTACAAPLQHLLGIAQKMDLVIYVSDNESWFDGSRDAGTATARAWMDYKRKNPNAKLVMIDLTPNTTAQIKPAQDVLLVGGFSDTVFEVIDLFLKGEYGADAWVSMIDAIDVAETTPTEDEGETAD